MLIIVEGCDGVGKTTFAERLQGATQGELLHYGPPTRPAVSEYTDDLASYEPNCGRDIVCDRYHWGELIYGPLYRGGSELAAAGLDVVNEFLRERGAVVVFLWNTPTTLRERHTRTGEDYLQGEHVEHVCDAYDLVASQSPLPVLRFRDPVKQHVYDTLAVARAFETNAAENWRETRG